MGRLTLRGSRRQVLGGVLGALTIAARSGNGGPVQARHHHRKRRKRCDKQCKKDHKTCSRGCDILDDDSQHFCKQSCKVAQSQCKSEC